jgi:hypothetical protein
MTEPLSALGASGQPDAATAQYLKLLDALKAKNPYSPGSEEWQSFEDRRPAPPSQEGWWQHPVEAAKNVGKGLAGTYDWFLKQARKPEAEVQADFRGKVGDLAEWGANVIPKAFEASEERRLGGNYNPGPILNAAMLGTSGGLIGGTGEEIGTVLQAGMRRRPLPPRPAAALEANPRAVIGGNMPPEAVAAEAPAAAAPVAAPIEPQPQTWAQGLPRPKPAAQSTDLPNIRGLPLDEAIAIARTQPHLIKAGEGSEGLYVGGPRNIQTKQQLNAQRKAYDDYVAADPRGGDWYERYRPALNLSTGGDPSSNQYAAAQHGQWSAGVDPGSELHYVLKEANAALAGMPERANYGAQSRAHLKAIAADDPSLYQLADKTEEYANQISRGIPGGNPLVPGATAVNDFRALRNWGYTEPGGEPQKGAPGPAAHRFTDMETALAVDRANRSNLGGRSDWTGEQLQAAPWVRQKALDLMSRNKALTYEEAFQRANRTIADYFPSKTYNATYEAQPGADVTGHMQGSVKAGPAERQDYFNDPGSTWATAPMGRDAIYAGLRTPGRGYGMRVMPTEPMTGMYRRPDGTLEMNPGEIAQPMGTFKAPPGKDFVGPREEFEPFKQATAADKAILNAGEHFRALIDAQNAGSWHKTWTGGPANQSNSLYYPRNTGTAAPLSDLLRLQGTGTPRGLPDVTDSARGSVLTRFWPPPEGGKAFDQAMRKGEFSMPGMGEPTRVRLDSGLAELVNEWKLGEGSGAATRKMLEHVTATPELEAAFNNNPYLAERALAKYERDKVWAGRWGAPREDIQNLRQMVAKGPGWVDRVKAALKDGSVSLPAVGALLAGAAAMRQQDREGS